MAFSSIGRSLVFNAVLVAPRRFMSSLPSLEYVKMDLVGTGGRVGLVTLNRPKSLNALSTPLMADLVAALQHLDGDDNVGCIVLTQAIGFAGTWRVLGQKTAPFLRNE